MTRVAIDIYRSLGVENNSLAYASNLSELGTILCLEEKWQDAANVYEELEKAIAAWDGTRRADLLLTPARVYMLYNTGRLAAGLEQARLMVHRVSERVGESHFDHAVARGVLAIGLFRSGHDAEAAKEFRAAVPFLTRVAVENDDDVTDSAARESYVRRIIESYIALSVRTSAAGDQATIAETFQLAESIRAHAVQKALVASALRMVARDGALADLIRKEQDLEKQLGAELGLLNNLLGLPSKQRDGAVVDRLTEQIATLRHEQANASAELKKRFPDYAEFVDPAPPTAADVQAMLRPRESFLSIYVGHDQSFVWAIPKEGALRLTALALPAAELEKTVVKLRAALEPQAAMISDIPPFDVALAFDLYARLLGPVEDGWRPSKSLIVVANGALGLLPLSLLPTAPSTIDIGDDPLFASYRNVPWLARTHAVTTVPSAAALRALRSLPATASGRSRLVAFGDPVFSSEQLQEAEQPVRAERPDIVAMRGAPLKRRNTPKLDTVDSAELAMLPRLPDTAEELRSIAAALKVDPATQVYLGRRADEQTVKTMDLSKYAIVAFATHGLVPGELNGLTQPALALSSPEVTGGSGDGLLTMDEILGLKLDADWVVLSACNTAAGSGAGAEAASGLGQAFFYAGTRAVLVTNWSVHSQSARELVTDLFRRQADDSAVTRSEALRRAMMALVDGPGYGGADGKTVFTYAHPLFWAPYTIIGDGG
jgi:CHAT domain-containing protein